jgi:hypothetical protein
MTTSSLRLARWLAEYAQLLGALRADAGRVWSGMAELFELYFLHAFHAFADVSLAELSGRQQQRQVPVVPRCPCMHAALTTICRGMRQSTVRLALTCGNDNAAVTRL